MKNKSINFILLTALCMLSKNTLSMENNIPHPHTTEVQQPHKPSTIPYIMDAFDDSRTVRCPFKPVYEQAKILTNLRTKEMEFDCPWCLQDAPAITRNCPECPCKDAISIAISPYITNIQCSDCGFDALFNDEDEKISEYKAAPRRTTTITPTPQKSLDKRAAIGTGLISIIGAAGYGAYKYFNSNKGIANASLASLRNKVTALKAFLNKHKEIAIGGGIGLGLFAALTLRKANLADKIKDKALPFICKKSTFIENHSRILISLIPNNKIINAGLSMAGGALSGAAYKLLRTRINKRTAQA